MTTTADKPTESVLWEGMVAPLDVETVDHRLIALPVGELRTRELPLLLLYRAQPAGGHEAPTPVGLITRIWVGVLDGPHYRYGLFAEGAAQENTELGRRLLRGEHPTCGVDLDQATLEVHQARDGQPLQVAAGWRLISVTVYGPDGVPAFPGAHIRLKQPGAPRVPSFTCPDCGSTSPHPDDVANAYCPNCHTFPENRQSDGLLSIHQGPDMSH